MRRVAGDDGAVAILVALLLPVVLLGFGAIVLDVGSLYAEKRQLQNAADGAALAVATDCAAGSCGAFKDLADRYADSNANDLLTDVTEVCGIGPGLTACITPPTVIAGVQYVHVKVQTEEAGGTNVMPGILAKALVPSYAGTTVLASATVAWGAASTVSSALPMTMSQCEVDKHVGTAWSSTRSYKVNDLVTYADALYRVKTEHAAATTFVSDKFMWVRNGDGYANLTTLRGPPPVYPAYPEPEEAVVFLHDTTGASNCPAGPAGGDLAGGFGWLDVGKTTCTATSNTDQTYSDKTGVPPPNGCTPADFEALIGQVVQIPIFDSTNGLTGNNGTYTMTTPAAFFLTGYSITGQYKHPSIVSRGDPCPGQATCISGYFVKSPPGDGDVGPGPNNGVTVTQIVG